MERITHKITVKGKGIEVPALRVGGAVLVTTGKSLKTATIHDEEWLDDSIQPDPIATLALLKTAPLRADIFSFAQHIPHTEVKHSFHHEWDNSAVVTIDTFTAWWESLPQESRKNVRRGEKRGVTARSVVFDDNLVAGIKAIYDEAPARQGRPFWHYGKSFEEVKQANATYLERSEFVGAYLGDELIGFIKMVYIGPVARIMQILSKNAHADKRPPNILLTKAIEVCAQRGKKYFIYGQYYYGNKGHTPITEFKRRNGFECVKTPRYFVALTAKGRLAMALKLHKGAKNLIPKKITSFLLDTRAKYHARKAKKTGTGPAPAGAASSEN